MERPDEGFLMQDEGIGDLHELRLMALLRELVREHSLRGAARRLEIDHRTIAGCMEQGTLTPTARRALERALHLGMGSAFEEVTSRLSVLEGRVKEMDGRLKSLSKVVEQGQTESKASLESLVEMVRSTDRKVEKLGTSAVRTADGKKTESSKSAGKEETPKKTKWFPRRTYPELVTREPAEDDEYVYKEALPAVQEWRELTKGHPVKGKTLSWMKRQERMLEVEQRLIDEFQLTLPPDRRPLTKEWRKKQLRWHDEDLRSIRGRIVRRLMLRWVRRILTFGLWRK